VDVLRSEKSDAPGVLARLRELIGALDRRAPRPDRKGESHIATQSAALRVEAVERIADLEKLDARR
jgi:hypothetical protein